MHVTIRGGVAGLVLLASALPATAEDIYFTLYNESSRSLHYFYTSPSSSTSWGPDLLGSDNTLQAGSNGTVTIGDGSTECLYDFRFVLADGSETTAQQVDICSLNSYTIQD